MHFINFIDYSTHINFTSSILHGISRSVQNPREKHTILASTTGFLFNKTRQNLSCTHSKKTHKKRIAMIALAPHLAFLFLCIAQANAFTNPVLSSKYAAKSALRMSEGPPYAGPLTKPLLDSVEFPHDMKDFSIKDLKQVCAITSLFTN